MSDALAEIWDLLQRHGGLDYHGEAVTQLEHALQAAALAAQEMAPPALVVAALLHDIGHLLEEASQQSQALERDLSHEALAADWLGQRGFPAEVVEPIRLHVPAKRYLCQAEPGYVAALSPASVASLRVQGGPMTDPEAQRFRAGPHFQAALRLRGWDEQAKVPGLKVPELDCYRELLARFVSPG
jgi:phosphonate degradation associated HDIG domain protein